MNAKIEIVKGASPKTLLLDGHKPVVLGRAESCDLHILAGPVSREHCRIEFDGKVWLLVDLSSRNGTWIGEERIKSRPLGQGEVFSLGKVVFIRFVHEAVASASAPKASAAAPAPVPPPGAPPKAAPAPVAPPKAAPPPAPPKAAPAPAAPPKVAPAPAAPPKAVPSPAPAKPAAPKASDGKTRPMPPPPVKAPPKPVPARAVEAEGAACAFCGEALGANDPTVKEGDKVLHPDCREFFVLREKEIGGVKIVERVGAPRPLQRLRAHQPSLKRHVLLHGFLPETRGGDEFRTRLLTEVRTVSRILHPRILQIHDLVEEKGVCLVVTEYFEGRPLQEVLKKQNFVKVPAALQIATQIAEGLAHAETQDYALDRLRPSDIYVDDDSQAKIDLFRPPLALPLDVSAVCYVAPEVVSAGGLRPTTGRPEVTHVPEALRSAVYSLGAILYHMLAGIAPFGGDTVEDLMPKILNKAPPNLSRVNLKVSPALARIVERAMSRDPAQRPADFRTLYADLRKLATPGV